MKLYIKRIIFLILIIIWMSLIFSLSAQTATDSGDLSGGIIDKILNLFGKELADFDINEIDFMQFIIRKCAHMCIYIILSVLVTIELLMYSIKKQYILSCIISVCYAISDEIHQYFVPGRSCELRDVLIDTFGVIIGMLIVKFGRKLADKTKQISIDKNI